jgi:hypothetical protein
MSIPQEGLKRARPDSADCGIAGTQTSDAKMGSDAALFSLHLV